MKLQQLLSYTRKAVDEYQMIEDGDHIAVCISGGKDSLTLLYALHGLKRFYPKKFELSAIGYDMAVRAEDGSIILMEELTQRKSEELLTDKVICELIDNCDLDSLKIAKNFSDTEKRIVKKGFEIFKNKTISKEKELNKKK